VHTLGGVAVEGIAWEPLMLSRVRLLPNTLNIGPIYLRIAPPITFCISKMYYCKKKNASFF
jgi:hypothetical protein